MARRGKKDEKRRHGTTLNKYSPSRETSIRLVCPMSGQILEGIKVGPHSISVLRCKNGSLTAACIHHGTRVFISAPEVVILLMRDEDAKSAETA